MLPRHQVCVQEGSVFVHESLGVLAGRYDSPGWGVLYAAHHRLIFASSTDDKVRLLLLAADWNEQASNHVQWSDLSLAIKSLVLGGELTMLLIDLLACSTVLQTTNSHTNRLVGIT